MIAFIDDRRCVHGIGPICQVLGTALSTYYASKAVVAEPMIVLALGERWAPAAPVVQVLAGIFAVQTLSSALQPLVMAMGRTRLLFLRDCVNIVIRVPLMVAGVMLGAVIGAALYIGSLLISWLISGRPRGPEQDFLQIAARVFPPLRRLAGQPSP
ncbi:MAG: hypothetical protein ACK40A_12820 [Pannonibacter indicus]